ncbi:two component transcriptional regulator, LuxR family [Flavobacterium micromati]|jgi:DNA-binding NarL/FixJ family response regulator|uniref:Two component transcriptional regulator, LuxR family n=1 Tax=Flavobacterium micromati TaxID=229205 RepID=A0A1M5QHW2_9FLAO|nr:response regulator transcription factor [Flavobacterium micromati]MCL6460410.1 response regulator transcription factor [Flavobacterium micromati]SHH13682.1 two component transcriptional regulator, LuxR family [Flavobacterium micromati]
MINKTRIHLADDHQILIDGIKTLLQTNASFEVVGTSVNGINLFDEVSSNNVDILILDINMPGKDGIEVIKEFVKKGFPCKVIILSSHDDLRIIKEVMNLGGSAYLTKKCAGENIIDAILAVNRGEEYFCRDVHQKIFTTVTKGNLKLNKRELHNNVILTERELEIIILISLEFSGKEISDQLFISANTVETHRKNIMKKLDAKNSISLVKYAIKNKLVKP